MTDSYKIAIRGGCDSPNNWSFNLPCFAGRSESDFCEKCIGNLTVGERVDRPDTNRGTNPLRPPALSPIGEQICLTSLPRVRPGLHMAGQPHRVSCESTVPRMSPATDVPGHADYDHTRTEPVLADPRSTLARFGPSWRTPCRSPVGEHTIMSGALCLKPNRYNVPCFRIIV